MGVPSGKRQTKQTDQFSSRLIERCRYDVAVGQSALVPSTKHCDSGAKMLTCFGEVMSDLHHSMYVQVMTLLMYGLV